MSNKDKREEALNLAKEELREADNRDKFMIKAVKFLDQQNKNFNSEMERFRDLYSLHFPELEKEITDDSHLIKILSKGVNRNNLESFSELADKSTGTELTESDRELLEHIHSNLEDRQELRKKLEDSIESIAKEEMPNLEKLLDPLLTARLVALAGGLENLSRKPSSTIQMLGAEKALFRYLKGEGTPPKHGIIFQHKFVNSLPENKRGKMARFMANKAALAARLDYYGDKEKGKNLRKECREKFEELKEDN